MLLCSNSLFFFFLVKWPVEVMFIFASQAREENLRPRCRSESSLVSNPACVSYRRVAESVMPSVLTSTGRFKAADFECQEKN